MKGAFEGITYTARVDVGSTVTLSKTMTTFFLSIVDGVVAVILLLL